MRLMRLILAGLITTVIIAIVIGIWTLWILEFIDPKINSEFVWIFCFVNVIGTIVAFITWFGLVTIFVDINKILSGDKS